MYSLLRGAKIPPRRSTNARLPIKDGAKVERLTNDNLLDLQKNFFVLQLIADNNKSSHIVAQHPYNIRHCVRCLFEESEEIFRLYYPAISGHEPLH